MSDQDISSQNKILIEQFLDSIRLEQNLAENTIESYKLDLFALSQSLQLQQVNFITAQSTNLQEFLLQRVNDGYKASSSARLLNATKRFFQYLYQENYRTDDPRVISEGSNYQCRVGMGKYCLGWYCSCLYRTFSLVVYP